MSKYTGLVLLVGPPCAGKTKIGEALAAQVGLVHAALPALLKVRAWPPPLHTAPRGPAAHRTAAH
eukprot:1971599-Prymnesium_polylepis.1